MQLVHWTVRWSFSVNTTIHASQAAKQSNNVIIIGAGFSGLGLGVLLKWAGVKFIILEKAEEIGGTWWYNDYPGAAVDVKSHTYCFSFYPNRAWSDRYSVRDEILAYLRDIVLHFQLKQYIRLKVWLELPTWSYNS